MAFSCAWEGGGQGRVAAAQTHQDVAHALGLEAKETKYLRHAHFPGEGTGELWIQRDVGVLYTVCTSSQVAASQRTFPCWSNSQ